MPSCGLQLLRHVGDCDKLQGASCVCCKCIRLELHPLLQAYRAALAENGSDLRFVQWMRGIGLLTTETYRQLEMRYACCDDLVWTLTC